MLVSPPGATSTVHNLTRPYTYWLSLNTCNETKEKEEKSALVRDTGISDDDNDSVIRDVYVRYLFV